MKQLQLREAETIATRDFEDTAIAATGAVQNLTVVTVNERHFKDFGVAFMSASTTRTTISRAPRGRVTRKRSCISSSNSMTRYRGLAAAVVLRAPGGVASR